MARLSIEVSEAEHHEIKALAALSGKTIRQFILDKVVWHERTELRNSARIP